MKQELRGERKATDVNLGFSNTGVTHEVLRVDDITWGGVKTEKKRSPGTEPRSTRTIKA